MSILGILLHYFFILLAKKPKNTGKQEKKNLSISFGNARLRSM